MSNTTTALDAHGAVSAPQKPRGVFLGLVSAIIAWREAEARRIVDSYLATLSDDQLRDLGYDPAVVRARVGRGTQFSVWS